MPRYFFFFVLAFLFDGHDYEHSNGRSKDQEAQQDDDDDAEKKKRSAKRNQLLAWTGSSTFPRHLDGDDKHFFVVFHSDNVLCLSHNAGRDQM